VAYEEDIYAEDIYAEDIYEEDIYEEGDGRLPCPLLMIDGRWMMMMRMMIIWIWFLLLSSLMVDG